MTGSPAIIALTAAGEVLAGRIAAALPGSEVLGLAGRTASADIAKGEVGPTLRSLFSAGRPVIGICAAGVLIRALAPLLQDKRAEPAVVAVAEDGSAVVPLLGGHRGANELARRVAEALEVKAAVTTAGDLHFGIALDDPPPGLHLANPEHVKPFAAALLAGRSVRLEGASPWLAAARLPVASDAGLVITVGEGAVAGSPEHLVYHPRRLAVGVGCERGADAEELLGLVRGSLAEAGLAEASVGGVFSLDLKADEPAIAGLSARYGVQARFFDADTLERMTPRLETPSDVVFRAVGTHGVAEAAALAGAGEGGRLLLAKRKSPRATCAIALAADAAILASSGGSPRGRLLVVGTGPGDHEWITPQTERLLGEASEVVGYGLYLDLLGRHIEGKRQHRFALGEEVARVRHAVSIAAGGATVALVSSGDPGIYAMATLVFEVLDGATDPSWRAIEVEVAPGISALQAAAARAGAPLGHDFCAISLSDLLTPWSVIERRIRAAAEADFVIAFYNPVSRRRTDQLARARDLLLAHRPEEVPVVLARNIGREGERIEMTSLAALSPAAVDMLTLVLVGASTTRTLRCRDGRLVVYTPRGYDAGQAEREVG